MCRDCQTLFRVTIFFLLSSLPFSMLKFDIEVQESWDLIVFFIYVWLFIIFLFSSFSDICMASQWLSDAHAIHSALHHISLFHGSLLVSCIWLWVCVEDCNLCIYPWGMAFVVSCLCFNFKLSITHHKKGYFAWYLISDLKY